MGSQARKDETTCRRIRKGAEDNMGTPLGKK